LKEVPGPLPGQILIQLPDEQDEPETVDDAKQSPLGTTAVLRESPLEKRDALPFRGKPGPTDALPAHLAKISLEAHALFSALLIVFPERQTQIFAQYGVADATERKLLDRHWFARLTDDQAMGDVWIKRRNQAIAHYRAAPR
jgi:hypothetical protein